MDSDLSGCRHYLQRTISLVQDLLIYDRVKIIEDACNMCIDVIKPEIFLALLLGLGLLGRSEGVFGILILVRKSSRMWFQIG